MAGALEFGGTRGGDFDLVAGLVERAGDAARTRCQRGLGEPPPVRP